MTWAQLIPLIAKYGLPWAYQFWQTVQNKENPTEADWQTLLNLANKPLDQYIAEAKARAAAAEPGMATP